MFRKLLFLLLVFSFFVSQAKAQKDSAYAQNTPPLPGPFPAAIDSVRLMDSLWNLLPAQYFPDTSPLALDSFHLADSAWSRHRVFLAGERHDEKANDDLSFAMLRYLNREFGVRTLVLEQAYAVGLCADEYLRTGDTILLEDLPSREYWKKLYDYNRSLPAEKRLRVVGADIESSFGWSGWMLHRMALDGGVPHPSIAPTVATIYRMRRPSRLTRKKARRLAFELDENMKAYPREYRKFLGDKYEDFRKCVLSMKTGADIYVTRKSPWVPAREQYLYEFLYDFLKSHPDEKVFGQFGNAHVCLLPEQDWAIRNSTSVTSMLNRTPELQNRICIFPTIYTDGDCGEATYQWINRVLSDDEICRLVRRSKPGFTFFKLDQADSLLQGLDGKAQFMIINNREW